MSFLLVTASLAFAQDTGRFKFNPDKWAKTLSGGNGISGLIRQDPISTGIRNVKTDVDIPDDFMNGQKPYGIHKQPRNKKGAYLLTPGFYEMRLKSFCLMAGTHAPGEGDGYLYAPLAGRQAGIFNSILRKWETQPDIDQKDVQLLLWALLAKADFTRMNDRTRKVAMSLMRPGDIARINKMAIIKTALTNIEGVSPALLNVLNAESNLRNAFNAASSSYEQLESIAMLVGTAVVDRPEIKRGRWSKHPDGYYVRYFPDSYSKTVVQIYVPDAAGDVEFDPTDDVAVPVNTGAQRLAQSSVPYDISGYPPGPAPRRTPVLTPDVIAAAESDGKEDEKEGENAPEVLENQVDLTTLANADPAPDVVVVPKQHEPEPKPSIDTIARDFDPEAQMIAGQKFILKNIQFEQSKSELTPAGKSELDRVAEWLNKYTDVRIEVAGHTSDEGQHERNVRLSRARANACRTYLIRRKIHSKRVVAQGYGPDRPIVPQKGDQAHLNRRVEMRLL
ncbi:MAG: OmpA family protein [Dyadobacter fermentans]